jgi:hypothetical protein
MKNKYSLLILISMFYHVNASSAEFKAAVPSRSVAQESKVIITDIIYRLEEHDYGYKIMFTQHAGIYRLRKSSKNFETIAIVLKKSKENREEIKIVVDATTLELEELVLSAK